MKRERGEFIGAFAPYGYKKDPNDKNSLIVDEEAAEVVKSIYHWFVNEGYSKMGIAKRLNQMGEPNPEAYKKKKGFKYNNPNSDKNDGLWSASTIVRILQNEVYTGVMVQGRNRVISYKVHKQINVPEEEWFVVPNTHEAIIDRETFEKAQAYISATQGQPPANRKSISCPLCPLRGLQKGHAAQNRPRYCLLLLPAATPIRRFAANILSGKTSWKTRYWQALQMQIALVDRLAEEIERINNAPVINRKARDYPIP